MKVPCVVVDRTDGEETRQTLATADVLADDWQITVEDGTLYLPVTDPDAVPDEYTIQYHEVPAREQPTMPADLVDFDVSYERIGDIVIIDEDDADRAQQLADAIVESDLPVTTVLNRASKIKGELRVRDWEVLAGNSTETVHREYGFEYALDLDSVYFSPRLATERHRVTEQITAAEQVLDMFAGVGPFVIPAAAQGATTVGVDKNEVAIQYLNENAARNSVSDHVTAIAGDVRAVTDEYTDWADRLMMNLPHSADQFVDTALALAGDECLIHYYDIQHEDDPFGPAKQLFQEHAEEYSVTVENERIVRSYAPHELNVVLDIKVSR
ncbi:class I SAM-dependent methyltransferase family protein [Salinarchaeum sp. IM2453]|uniref:class I SAM-dependent methyltransferase n=1 Tax=Salinarchaeum sp. IM2453 TaxID=2862870 RepID=UPI001C82BB24|nr:class I SAM-dependent methyltransferase family protein [Salinarchaeum sp. IM2453]QZA89021.1 class I SAM-dependent methyltransferase family protein [Salinarchaeum sp. IM2453]